MADDKGGGSNWEAFEIIIVILLAIGLLSRLQGKPITAPDTDSSTKQQIATPATDAAKPTCGLNVVRPHALEKIQSSVTLTGNVAGCNWPATETVALYAQVVDSYGLPVSAYTAVAPSGFASTNSAVFSTTIALTGNPAPGTGYLILIPSKNPDGRSITSRIPIKF